MQGFANSIINSYGQVFFSNKKTFSLLLLVATFVDFYTGAFGFFAVITTNAIAYWLGFERFKINQGYYGFNSLLVGLGLGIYFQPSLLLLLIVFLAGVFTLFISVTMEGVIGKYALPYLSIPFVISLWALTLASREFMALGLNERGIYTLNDLYIIGGGTLVNLYEWFNAIPLPSSVRSYLLSLGAILFQYNVFTGIVIAIGLLLYSRIGFTLSLIGFYTAYLFYMLIGARFSEVHYSYIGFNYILSAIALGGFFLVPNRSTYLWVALIVPLVAIVTISLSAILTPYFLPVYSLPFNLVALVFLYVLKFRVHNRANLNPVYIQQNSPEKNLYSFVNFMDRFGKDAPVPVHLPFFGDWTVTQGHDGNITHKGSWKHAWDFEIKDEEGKTYKNGGDFADDYYCFGKNIISPADGVIEEIIDDIPDNTIGDKNLEYNWGNTIVIKHTEFLYSKLCHLKPKSIVVQVGQRVKRGDFLAKCGNSGNSPYPHLHFQLQTTPYIGSKTIDYPISNYLVMQADKPKLMTNASPQEGEIVSSIHVDSSLRKAFHLVPGEKLWFKVTSNEDKIVGWDVKLDYYLNKYVECEATKSKAYFKVDEAMLYFTHFVGDRNSLLYYFYLAAFKVCFGKYKDLSITDSYPTNMVFSAHKLLFHDFSAPFVQYMKGKYQLTYDGSEDPLGDASVRLEATTEATVLGKIRRRVITSIFIDRTGLVKINVEDGKVKYTAQRIDQKM
ncbi:MAG: urea transporter [Tenuifilaceae bacterium]|jgi:urea transporter/murein DD-endopeptidase MepM/ murein hydrolase activator NlpD|nr:urea transporter [Tenuifilaceae bacterium]